MPVTTWKLIGSLVIPQVFAIRLDTITFGQHTRGWRTIGLATTICFREIDTAIGMLFYCFCIHVIHLFTGNTRSLAYLVFMEIHIAQ